MYLSGYDIDNLRFITLKNITSSTLYMHVRTMSQNQCIVYTHVLPKNIHINTSGAALFYRDIVLYISVVTSGAVHTKLHSNWGGHNNLKISSSNPRASVQ